MALPAATYDDKDRTFLGVEKSATGRAWRVRRVIGEHRQLQKFHLD